MKILPFVILAKARIQTCLIPTIWILLRLKDWNDNFTFGLYFHKNLGWSSDTLVDRVTMAQHQLSIQE